MEPTVPISNPVVKPFISATLLPACPKSIPEDDEPFNSILATPVDEFNPNILSYPLLKISGVVVPIPTLPPERMRILSVLFVEITNG